MWWEHYLDVPFVDFGRSRAGCDCWGLVRLIEAEQFGRQLPSYVDEYAGYGRHDGIGGAIARNLDDYDIVTPGAEREGDIVLITLSGIYAHIGVVTVPGRMIHAVSPTRGVVIEPYRDMRYRNRVELCRAR